jgi:hypothetical protein
MTPNLIPRPSTWLYHTRTFAHAREYAQAMHALSLSNTHFFYSFQMEQNIFTKKLVMLYNTFNTHENATLPLLIPRYMFFVCGSFSNYVVLMIKNAFRHLKRTIV